MRPTQQHLLDDTPLALFGGQGQGLALDRPETPEAAPVATAARVRPSKRSFSSIRSAAQELQAVREDMASAAHEPLEDLKARVDAVGQWAATQKPGKGITAILQEAHQLADKLEGGSGKGGVRIHPLPDTMRQEIAADVATRTCLQARCGKAARDGSHFCSAKCKKAWTANMAAWHNRLDRTPIDDTQMF